MRDPWSKIIARESLADELAQPPGVRVVLANGLFDVLHVGHARYLAAARAAGDRLVVALNDDASARANRGIQRPLIPLAERMLLIAGLACVDWVTWFPETTVAATLSLLRPACHAKGTDYRPSTLPAEEQAVHHALGIAVVSVGDEKTHATSDIVKTVLARYSA
ncbi:MAG: adenylyltransferase/cytidyltransferase family protein [Acidobacteriota bacterium]